MQVSPAGLKHRLNAKLPGLEAQLRMAPRPIQLGESLPKADNKTPFRQTVPHSNSRRGAVMLLLYNSDGHSFFPLMKRPQYDGVHSGQVSLPGGGQEANDEDLINTALRETHEEVGIRPEEISILGQLTDLYIAPSDYYIKPVVGFLNSQPTFIPDEREVARLFSVKAGALLDTARISEKTEERRGIDYRLPYYDLAGEIVWGATAMILSEFSVLLRSIEDEVG